MKLKDVTKIKKESWKELGGKLVTRIVQDSDSGISQDGSGQKRDFKPYSFDYAIKKKAGIPGPKGVSTDRQTSPPNLRLTGKMLNSLKVQRATANSVEINYRDGKKVIGHSKRRGKKPKRNIYGLNNKNQEFVKNYIEENIDERIIKFYKKKIIFDVKV